MSERVLLVDDDALVRRVLTRSRVAGGFEVEHVADGGAALAAAEASAPDLVVLDVTMPGLDGLAVCRRLRANGLRGSILMLTARDAVADRVAGLQAGADDYLVKPLAPEEVVAPLRALPGRPARGAGPQARTRRPARGAQLLPFDDLALDLGTRTAARGGATVELTARELELLELLMRSPRQVVTRERALADVWQDEAAPNVVDRYVTRLRSKLGEPSLIRTV